MMELVIMMMMMAVQVAMEYPHKPSHVTYVTVTVHHTLRAKQNQRTGPEPELDRSHSNTQTPNFQALHFRVF